MKIREKVRIPFQKSVDHPFGRLGDSVIMLGQLISLLIRKTPRNEVEVDFPVVITHPSQRKFCASNKLCSHEMMNIFGALEQLLKLFKILGLFIARKHRIIYHLQR